MTVKVKPGGVESPGHPVIIVINPCYRYLRTTAVIAKEQVAALREREVTPLPATMAAIYWAFTNVSFGCMLDPRIVFSATVPEGKAWVFHVSGLDVLGAWHRRSMESRKHLT